MPPTAVASPAHRSNGLLEIQFGAVQNTLPSAYCALPCAPGLLRVRSERGGVVTSDPPSERDAGPHCPSTLRRHHLCYAHHPPCVGRGARQQHQRQRERRRAGACRHCRSARHFAYAKRVTIPHFPARAFQHMSFYVDWCMLACGYHRQGACVRPPSAGAPAAPTRRTSIAGAAAQARTPSSATRSASCA